MGAWINGFQFVLLCYTVMLHFSFFENLQVQALTGTSFSQHLLRNQIREMCRFGNLLEDESTCECRTWNCVGFSKIVCLKRDGGSHQTLSSDCTMLAHACKSGKKKLQFWYGTCDNVTGEHLDAGEHYCNGSELVNKCLHGICLRVSSNSSRTYCRCKKGYTGSRCEEILEDGSNSRHRRSSHHRLFNSTISTFIQHNKKLRILKRLEAANKLKSRYNFVKARHKSTRILG